MPKVYTKVCKSCGDEFETTNKDKRGCSRYCSRQLNKPAVGYSGFNKGRPV